MRTRKFGLFVAPAVGCAMLFAVPTEAANDFPYALFPGSSFGGGGVLFSSDDYLLDDGLGETNLAWSAGNGGDLYSLNQFTVLAGFETLTAISIAWGTSPNGGSPAMLLVFSDPNNDGDPTDITPVDLLFSAPILTGIGPTDDYQKFNVGAVALGAVGDSFFVGMWTSTPPGDFPARIDQTAPQNRSWAAGGNLGTTDPFDPNNPGNGLTLTNLNAFPFNGNYMIRGNAIPVPGALALLGVAGLIGARRRRR